MATPGLPCYCCGKDKLAKPCECECKDPCPARQDWGVDCLKCIEHCGKHCYCKAAGWCKVCQARGLKEFRRSFYRRMRQHGFHEGYKSPSPPETPEQSPQRRPWSNVDSASTDSTRAGTPEVPRPTLQVPPRFERMEITPSPGSTQKPPAAPEESSGGWLSTCMACFGARRGLS